MSVLDAQLRTLFQVLLNSHKNLQSRWSQRSITRSSFQTLKVMMKIAQSNPITSSIQPLISTRQATQHTLSFTNKSQTKDRTSHSPSKLEATLAGYISEPFGPNEML
jgi:hypothetical protein